MSEHVEKRAKDGVLSLVLARPEKKNALTGAMYDALVSGFAEASGDDGIGAILLSGGGGVFTAGNDIGDFLRLSDGLEVSPGGRFLQALATFEKPIVAAVEGPAVGIGATLCFHCDLVYAAPGASFQMPFVNLALVPENASSLLAPRRFGMAKASEYLLLGEAFDAAEACRLGLVNEVVDAARLHPHALAKAKALAAKPRAAMLATRKLLRGDPTEIVDRIAKENRAFAAALRSPEARAFFSAFLQKSKAS
jgi:enoyl-CoA hydratase/carnithine racemase